MNSLLSSQKLMAFVGTRNPGKAKVFYRDQLGLELVSEDDFAIVFNANGTLLRVSGVPELLPATFTVLGWQVADVSEVVKGLEQAGVSFERYKGLEQDEHGIWTAPGGTKVAWFKDPDGNILSVSQH